MEENLPDIPLMHGVSVVVCCFNSARVIIPTIVALSRQSIPAAVGYEVILVDNNCTDDTVRLAREAWQNSDYPLRIIEEREPGLLYARKKGVANASFDILLFVDDDNILEPGWVETLHRLYRDMPEVGAVGGLNEIFFVGKTPKWLEHYNHIYACGPRAETSGIITRKVFGAGVSFRTAVIRSVLFSNLPLFLIGRKKNELLRGEDTEMVFRAFLSGWKFYYDDSLRLKHYLLENRVNWEYVCRAVKGGGNADIILSIYRDLLAGKHPANRRQLFAGILKSWRNYLKKNYKYLLGLKVKDEGTEYSARFHWLYGSTIGFYRYWRSYSGIREKIIEYYPKV
jgi:glycosyltransferase involved in cell wall biosynthesis